jgi:hypothetical protein
MVECHVLAARLGQLNNPVQKRSLINTDLTGHDYAPTGAAPGAKQRISSLILRHFRGPSSWWPKALPLLAVQTTPS